MCGSRPSVANLRKWHDGSCLVAERERSYVPRLTRQTRSSDARNGFARATEQSITPDNVTKQESERQRGLIMNVRRRTIAEIAEMICGDVKYFVYRSGSYLTEFFRDLDLDYVHDGSTRKWWVADVLERVSSGPAHQPHLPPYDFIRIIQSLMDRADADGENHDRSEALEVLNSSLAREGVVAYYDDNGVCQVKSTRTRSTTSPLEVSQGAWTKEQLVRRESLESFLDVSSEDDLTEEVLSPLFRHLGFVRVSVADHRDKALEYGKDMWMKFRLPIQHDLYFGVQVKKGTIHASARSADRNISELLAQVRMMLEHPIFDPEINRTKLVDHAIIVVGGEITKQARHWLGVRLSASERSQIIFLERNDILDLMVGARVPLPKSVEEEVALREVAG